MIPFQRSIDMALMSERVVKWMTENYMSYLTVGGRIDPVELAHGYAIAELGGDVGLNETEMIALIDWGIYVAEQLGG